MIDPVINVSGVTLYRGDTVILRGIDWRVERGQHWAIVGANGSGKTTLLNVVSGYLWPSAGEVSVLGEPFGGTDLRALRRRIGWVSTFLREMTPSHERALPMVLSGRTGGIGVPQEVTPEESERGRELLERIGCGHRIDHRFVTLSQGEQQRVMIARALMARPELLILDEVCAGLDLAARESFLETLAGLAAGDDAPTMLFVTHHIEEIIPAFTHALALEDGRVLKAGPKADVLTGGVLSGALGLPLEVHRHGDRFWPRAMAD
ncbi:MAG: ATP-binding cassette domain-containing protein [Armatimonadia bacterium]|nr:ATP-binding cassette domain-containing protein [Armatimonadia bacterium]